MSLNKLTSILPPPMDVCDNKFLQENVGLPSDYLEFIKLYGTGIIADFITIYNYASSVDDYNLLIQKDLILGDLQFLLDDDPKYYKYILYPNKDGLYPLGVTENGDYILWKTNENISDWKIAIIASRSPEVEFTEYNLTDFLVNTLTKKIVINAFPSSFPRDKFSFTPLKESS